jgi:ubiquinone/menaquinone biosynthesis C-methylase UbiE
VGAGSGELLRSLAQWSKTNDRRATLAGLELNERSARAMNDSPQHIFAIRGDAFRLPFPDRSFDYVMCSLFTHHFIDADNVKLFREINRVSRRKLFIIDLHRHPVAYAFYTTIAHLFFHNRLIREDGALSILRSFKPFELLQLARKANLLDPKIRRSFPYRLVLSASANYEEKREITSKEMRLAS